MSVIHECDCGCHLPDHWPFDCRVWSNDRSACCDNAPVHNRPYPGDDDGRIDPLLREQDRIRLERWSAQ